VGWGTNISFKTSMGVCGEMEGRLLLSGKEGQWIPKKSALYGKGKLSGVQEEKAFGTEKRGVL